MLTIAVNGREKKLNLGCRTFVSLDEILNVLKSKTKQVLLNGQTVLSPEFGKTMIKGGDTLEL